MCYLADRELGVASENELINDLSSYFDTELIKLSRYNKFDFTNSEKSIYIELKTRRCSCYQYATTMISYSKMEKGIEYLQKNKLVYFVFRYTDGVYYYQLTEDYKNYCAISKSGRADRGKLETNMYVFIPVDRLIKMTI